jgi:hypothetical protein
MEAHSTKAVANVSTRRAMVEVVLMGFASVVPVPLAERLGRETRVYSHSMVPGGLLVMS